MTRSDHPAPPRRAACAAALLLALAACATPEALVPEVGRTLVATPLGALPAPPALPGGAAGALRAFAEQPFQRGPMAVVAREGGRVETFGLAPCPGVSGGASGATVCAWGQGGPAGTVTETPDWVVVQGLFGRTFWLSDGGDGYVQSGDTLWRLSWSARVDGRGEGPFPQPADGSGLGASATLETGAPHR